MVDNINPGLQPVDIRDGLQQCLDMPAGTLNQGIVDIKKSEKVHSENDKFPAKSVRISMGPFCFSDENQYKPQKLDNDENSF